MITLVGVVGGIGSGKSAVAEQFRQLGAEVLDGDRLGHQVLADPEVIELLRQRWGERILASQEPPTIDRREVAKVVFAGTPEAETELRYLEGVTHPRIRSRIRQRIKELEQQGRGEERPQIAVLDAPLLLEAGWHQLCDEIIYVHVPQQLRLERLASRNWTAADLAAREARQLPVDQKRAAASWIVDNSGSHEELLTQIRAIWEKLTLPKRA